MKPTVRALLASSLLMLTLSSCAAMSAQGGADSGAQQQMARPSGKLEYSHFTLPNGLNVYLSRNPLEPRFYAQVVVNAGGKNDPGDATGIAHYLEHMLFKGTDEIGTADFGAEKALQDQIVAGYDQLFKETDQTRRSDLLKQINQLSVKASQYAIPGEFDQLYSRLGAEGLNAYTSNEETVYLVSMPKNRIEQWAMVESERFKDPVFRLFQSELETVYEEKNRSLDDKDDILREAVEAQLYKKHSYGIPVLGSVEHLKNPSLTKMYEFYHRYYVPNNMAIVIAGDIDIAQTRAIIEKYFSGWQKRDVAPFAPPAEDPIKGVEKVQVQYKGEERALLAFRTAPYGNPDRHALRMIDMLLDSGSAGLIKLNLVQPQKVRGAGTYPSFSEDYGAQYLWAVPKEGQSLAEAEGLLLEQLERIKQGDFDESIMKAIALDFEIGQKGALESNQARAGLMTEAFLNGTSVEELMSQPAKLRALSKQDVVRVANKYFGGDYISGHRIDKDYQFPEIQKPVLEKMSLNPNQTSPFVKKVEALAPAPVEPQWIDTKTAYTASSYAPGVVLHHSVNPINDLFSFSISYDYGDKHYLDKNFCLVMSELNEAGTGNLNAQAVANEFFKLGVNASYSCGDYGFSMGLSGTDENFEKALALSEQVMWNAKLDPARFSAKLENIVANREDEKKEAATLRSALRSWVRYGDESGFIDRPTAAELKQASTARYPLMTEQLKKQNFDIYYTGSLPRNQVESLVRKYHQPQSIPLPLLNPRKAPPLELLKRHDKPVKIYFLHNPGAQSSIDLIIPNNEVDPRETVISEYYNQYMDGSMGAIMFQEVRESRALAYSTFSYYAQGGRLGDQDQMLAYIGTQADKTPEAMALLIELMKNPPKSESHFNRARAALDNQYRTSRVNFREAFGTLEAWAQMGYDQDPRPLYFNQLDNVAIEDLFAYIQKKVASQPLTFTIVGDRAKVGLDALKKLGEVEEVKLDQLFRD